MALRTRATGGTAVTVAAIVDSTVSRADGTRPVRFSSLEDGIGSGVFAALRGAGGCFTTAATALEPLGPVIIPPIGSALPRSAAADGEARKAHNFHVGGVAGGTGLASGGAGREFERRRMTGARPDFTHAHSR